MPRSGPDPARFTVPEPRERAPLPADCDARLAAYDELVELVGRQLAAAEAGRLDEVERLQGRWVEIVSALPGVPPDAARPALRRAAALCDALGRRLLDERTRLDGRREAVQTGRRTAAAYGGPVGAVGGVDHVI
jgi:hypothetical protein